jgi:hypothetical protein
MNSYLKTALWTTSALLLFPEAAQAANFPLCSQAQQDLSRMFPGTQLIHEVGPTRNSFSTSLYISETEQVDWSSPDIPNLVESFLQSCGLVSVEFYSIPEGGATDNYLLPGAFDLIDGRVYRKQTCLDAAGFLSYCN